MDQVEQSAVNDLLKYPIAEIFTSPQGEGMYAGTMMTFIRFAGCTVGKRYPKVMYELETKQVGPGLRDVVSNKPLPIYTEMCTTYDGREFACDTDYRMHGKYTFEDIIAAIPEYVERICITGGEPLMHKFMYQFALKLQLRDLKVHIETSGTIDVNLPPAVWITISPKLGLRKQPVGVCNEIKLLVDSQFNPEKSIALENTEIHWPCLATQVPVYLQPINFENAINPENLKLCMAIQKKYPQFRVCMQLHKAISLITGDHVR